MRPLRMLLRSRELTTTEKPAYGSRRKERIEDGFRAEP